MGPGWSWPTKLVVKLILVYNADSGWLNAAWHSAHKLVFPKTYRCSLCAVTHHPLGMKKQWAEFIRELGCEVDFLHRDEAIHRFDLVEVSWPAVLRVDQAKVRIWLTAEQLDSASSLDQLKALIRDKFDADA